MQSRSPRTSDIAKLQSWKKFSIQPYEEWYKQTTRWCNYVFDRLLSAATCEGYVTLMQLTEVLVLNSFPRLLHFLGLSRISVSLVVRLTGWTLVLLFCFVGKCYFVEQFFFFFTKNGFVIRQNLHPQEKPISIFFQFYSFPFCTAKSHATSPNVYPKSRPGPPCATCGPAKLVGNNHGE